MKRILTAALLFVPMISALAQDLNPPKQVKDLGWMVGTWTGSGKIAFGDHTADITSTMTVSFDGQFLKAISIDKSAGSTLTKTTMTGWDGAKTQYVSYTFTNMAPAPRIAHGQMVSGKLQMISDPWKAEGFTMVSRETMSKRSATKCEMVMEYKQGGKWVTGMDFVYAKR